MLLSVSRIWTTLAWLDLVIVVRFKARPIFDIAPAVSKITLALKMGKSDSKLIISICLSKSATHSVKSLQNVVNFPEVSLFLQNTFSFIGISAFVSGSALNAYCDGREKYPFNDPKT